MSDQLPEAGRTPKSLRVDRLASSDADHISIELSSRRTGMSFQRTRMSADRTLMSVIRTALSLIGFGFTIFQVFAHLRRSKTVRLAVSAPRNFGIALVLLGIAMLVIGIVYHSQFMLGLRKERHADGRGGARPRRKQLSRFRSR